MDSFKSILHQELSVERFFGSTKLLEQEGDGSVYLLDIKRSTPTVLVVGLPTTEEWVDIPAGAVKSITILQTGDNIDPVLSPLVRLRFKEEFMSVPALLTNRQAVSNRVGVESSSRLQASTGAAESLDATPVVLQWNSMHVGDCQMDNATITFLPDGRGTFRSTVLTYHTITHDIWHIQITVLNQPGAVLFGLPTWDGPSMSSGNPPPRYAFNVDFVYNQTFLPAIGTARARSRC